MPPEARYTFKHALVQDTAYETLLASRQESRQDFCGSRRSSSRARARCLERRETVVFADCAFARCPIRRAEGSAGTSTGTAFAARVAGFRVGALLLIAIGDLCNHFQQ
jgi:hypothetical protein